MPLTGKQFSIALFFLSLSGACAQNAPEERPDLLDPAFDRMLTQLLGFETPLIGVEALKERREEFVLLDARSREEYEVSHIPGALWVGYGPSLQQAVINGLPEGKKVAVYCSVGYRSDQVGGALVEKKNIGPVYNVYGSIFEWANRGYPLEDERGNPTRNLHTYDRLWSLWVKDTLGLQKTW